MKTINTANNRQILYSALKRTTYMSPEWKRIVFKNMVHLLNNKNN